MDQQALAGPESVASTSTGLRRAKKVRSACERCRYRRIKCDGHVPACGNCAKAGVGCVDVEGHHMQRRVARGLTAGIASARISWLESIIRTELPHINLAEGPSAPSAHTTNTILGPIGTTYSSSSPAELSGTSIAVHDVDNAQVEKTPSQNSPRVDAASGQKRSAVALYEAHRWTTSLEQDTRSVALDLGLLSLNSESSQVHYLGSSSGSLFASFFQPRRREDIDGVNRLESTGTSWEPDTRIRRTPLRKNYENPSNPIVKIVHELYAKLREDLPPRKECDTLIQRFFDHMHPIHPFLHQPSFRCMIDALYECKEAPADCSIQHNGWPAEMKTFSVNGEEHVSGGLHMVSITSHAAAFQLFVALSIGATLQIRHRIYGNDPGALFRAATFISAHVFNIVSLLIVQCVLLLIVHCSIDPEGYNIWTLIHVAIAHSVDLGLHCEVGDSGKFSPLSAEMRRRVFFCIYSLDR
ncbi:aconitate hydratase [Phlyctema vagabunda]|uniref:Aconitate hydratase n=1 Tax=Phlyctema vagabunda TaxID=108571 RepID=A0ABR4PPY7_9HELO